MNFLQIIPRHSFHLVDVSPWPLITSVNLFNLTIAAVLSFHYYNLSNILLILSLFSVIFSASIWWRDVIIESTGQGYHTQNVQNGLKYGMFLFIVSEVMFFFAFFWAFFHSSLAPTIEIGSVWPPVGLNVFNAFKVPLLNTLILLLSGASITWAHFAILEQNYKEVNISFKITIALAIFFTTLQITEYLEATFRISDSVYGSTFYMATGFHGFHVIIGTIFIIVGFYRYNEGHFTKKHHFGFEASAWYWHFVDVVWLFLFISVYWWGNKETYFTTFYEALDLNNYLNVTLENNDICDFSSLKSKNTKDIIIDNDLFFVVNDYVYNYYTNLQKSDEIIFFYNNYTFIPCSYYEIISKILEKEDIETQNIENILIKKNSDNSFFYKILKIEDKNLVNSMKKNNNKDILANKNMIFFLAEKNYLTLNQLYLFHENKLNLLNLLELKKIEKYILLKKIFNKKNNINIEEDIIFFEGQEKILF